MAEDVKKTENILGRLIGVSWRSMRRQLDQNIIESNYEVSAEQGIILSMLSHYEKVNQQMLIEFINCEKTAITRWIDHLAKMKLVKRSPDKNDRRQNILSLTAKGKLFAAKFIDVGILTENQALRGVDPKKAKICKEVLKQIILNLETIQ